MLILPIKKKWYDMILSGKKKEEYREIKPYYISRFRKILGVPELASDVSVIARWGQNKRLKMIRIMFRNGYSKKSPSFIAKCTLSVGTGKEEWGAEKDVGYFILTIHEILKGSEV